MSADAETEEQRRGRMKLALNGYGNADKPKPVMPVVDEEALADAPAAPTPADAFVQQHMPDPSAAPVQQSTDFNKPGYISPAAAERAATKAKSDAENADRSAKVDAAVDAEASGDSGTTDTSGGVAPPPTSGGDNLGQKPAVADAEAARRAEFRQMTRGAADARLAAAQQPGRAVLVSKGGMMPSTQTEQITEGPPVKDADRLIAEQEMAGRAGAAGVSEAGKQRDTVLAGLQNDYNQGTAKLAGEEHKAAQSQSSQLSAVATRMEQALAKAAAPVQSPSEDLARMGVVQKIAFALASAASSMWNRDIYKGPRGNSFLENFDQAINQRISEQERQHKQLGEAAEGQKNLYGVLKDGFQSDDAARGAMRLMYLQALDGKMKEAAQHYNIDAANPMLQQMQAKISEDILKQQIDIAKTSGVHKSEEATQRYAPPQVAVIGGGGAGKEELAARKTLQELWDKNGMYDKKADLDTLNNIVRHADAGNIVTDYAAAHGMPLADAISALMANPETRQKMVDITQNLRAAVGSGAGMRSEMGRDIAKISANPAEALEQYNRLGHDYAERSSMLAQSLGPQGNAYLRRWQADAEDSRNSTNSPDQPQGAEPLPSALAPQAGATPPAPSAEQTLIATAKKSIGGGHKGKRAKP